jgi:TPR repeat protein
MRQLKKILLLMLAFGAGLAAFAQPLAKPVDPNERADYATAFPEYAKLAAQGDASAQYRLALMYANGRGVLKDDEQAVVWFRKAAEQGHAAAQYNLALMYDYGRGTPKDDEQAVLWYRKAAEQGDGSAQFNLGLRYQFGRGVARDEGTAYFWWLLSGAQGNVNAQRLREAMEPRLTPEQRANAQASARAWKPK